MSTVQNLRIVSDSAEHTLRIAAVIGHELRGGEVIELVSDLGGGKTVFVRGLADGMGSTDAVRSPSFTISNQYCSGRLTLYHFDFYRLDDAGIMRDEMAELVTDERAVIAVEWSDIISDVLPEDRIRITLSVSGESSRDFTIVYAQKFDYLFRRIDTVG